MRLRPNIRVLDRGGSHLQVGADPRWAFILSGLSEAERELVRELRAPGHPGTRKLRAICADRGVPVDRLDALLAHLVDAGLLSTSDVSGPPLPSALLDDAAAIESAVAGASGPGTLADRRRRTVALAGAGRLGMVCAGTLASAGVGVLLFDDARPVRPADVGVGGFRERHVGAPRSRAAGEVLGKAFPGTRAGAARSEVPDVVVVVFEEAADAMRTARLMSEGVPHLAVTVREGDVVIGPFVEPGSSPCLTCLDLHRTDQDPAWPVIAPQLRTAGRLAPAALDSSLAVVAGGLAAAQVLARLDGFLPTATGASIEVSIPDALPRLRRWEMHPDCGCVDVSPR